MRVVLFGGGNKGTVILRKLIELNQEVVGVFYFKEDAHENIWYEKAQDVAIANRIRAYKTSGVDTPIMEAMQPDIIFVVGWRYKIPKEQYSIPSKGTIVFHDSLLPKYRGFAPMNWAIINGEPQFGATMFYIADEIDSGDIIIQRANILETLDTAETVEQKITRMYIDMLVQMLPIIENGIVNRNPQNHSQATYTCKRIPEDGLIDWGQSTIKIYNLIRGLSYPYPNAFSYIDGKKVYIEEARLIEQRKFVGRVCGRVVDIRDEWVEVLTGDGSLMVRPDCPTRSIKATFRSCK